MFVEIDSLLSPIIKGIPSMFYYDIDRFKMCVYIQLIENNLGNKSHDRPNF